MGVEKPPDKGRRISGIDSLISMSVRLDQVRNRITLAKHEGFGGRNMYEEKSDARCENVEI